MTDVRFAPAPKGDGPRGNLRPALVALLSLAINLTGLGWGLPSAQLNRLYFSGEQAVRQRIAALKTLPVEETGKGMGAYLAAHPEESEKKLPRSWYNPIRSYHPDEYFVIKSLSTMDPGARDFNPHQFTVGGAYLYLTALIAFLLSRAGWIKLTGDLGFYLLHPAEMAGFYLVGRLITALYGAGLVWLICLTARRIWRSERAGLVSGILAAVSPLVLLNSHYMYVDIPGVFWIAAALYAAVRLATEPGRPGWSAYLLMGLCAGLAAGNKITFLAALLIPFLSILQEGRRLGAGGTVAGALSSLAGFAAALFATNPYLLLTWPVPLVELRGHTSLVFNGLFYLKSLDFGLGYPLAALAIAGLACGFYLKERRRALFVPAAWTVLFFIFISLFAQRFARYILPIVPALAAGGVGLWLEPGGGRRTDLIKKAALSFAAAATFVYGMAYLSLFLKPDTRTTAGVWIRQNLPAGAVIGVTEVPWQFQVPPLDEGRYRLEVTGYDFARLEKTRPRYLVLSSFQAEIPPAPEQMPPERTAFWDRFSRSSEYRLLASFRQPLSFAGVTFSQDGASEDLIYLNPTIDVFESVGR